MAAATEDERASRPRRPGLWHLVVRIYQEVGNDRVFLIAAGVTYYTLLALAPSLAVFVSIYGLFTDAGTVREHIDLLQGLLPPGGIEIITEQLERLTSTSQTQLSLTLAISLLLAFWSAGAGIRALLDAINVAYDVEERRPFLRLNLIAVLFTLGALLGLVLFVLGVVVLPFAFRLIALDRFEWIRIGSYGLMLVMLLLALEVLYRYGPYRQRPRWRWITPGAVFAVVGITVVSLAFSWYAANLARYSATYGSLGALVGFLTWIWLSVTIVIIGAELNAEMERDWTPQPAVPDAGKG